MPPMRNNGLAPVVLLAAFVTASSAASIEPDARSSRDHWQIVQAYIDDRATWTEKWKAISDAELDESEKRRRRTQLGPAPARSPAVEAAKAVIQNRADRALEAAQFLLGDEQEHAMLALASLVGPDWSVIRDHILNTTGSKAASGADLPRPPSPPDRPDPPTAIASIVRATAAANAILYLSQNHEYRRQAAEFLIEYSEPRSAYFVDGFVYPYRAAEALSSLYPNYDEWPRRIYQLKAKLAGRRSGPDFEKLNNFIASLATIAGDPSARASARYFTALLLLEKADDEFGIYPIDKRHAWRRRALELATGLSAGVTNERLTVAHPGVGTSERRTYADLEADLLAMIHTTTLGGNASSLKGRRLDGTVEPLSTYTDRLLLIDFWATWCGPCIEAIPHLRELAKQFPDDLRILAISVDDDVDTVSQFLAETSVPWKNWHLAQEGPFVRQWRVNAYPTYVLIDRGGNVLNRYSLTPIRHISSDIEQAIAGTPNPIRPSGVP